MKKNARTSNALAPDAVRPTLDEWRRLYAAAKAYCDLAPWKWMADTDIFAILNPEDGQTGIVCVMGNAEELFGLALYRGPEGSSVYWRSQTGEIGMDSADILLEMNSVMFSLGDRNEMQKEDLAIIRRLGLKYRGRNSWPTFVDYLPGFAPWSCGGMAARFMTHALEQAADVAIRFRRNRELLTPPASSLYFARMPTSRGESLGWVDQWIHLEDPTRPHRFQIPKPDLAYAKQVASKIRGRKGIWQFHFQMEPLPIGEPGLRPRFPFLGLWVDVATYYILCGPLAFEEGLGAMVKGGLDAIAEGGVCPLEVRVKSDDAMAMLKPVAAVLGFELRKMKELPQEEDVRSEFRKEMR